jgi:hypothetical protein
VYRAATAIAGLSGPAALFAAAITVAAACSHPQTPVPAAPSHGATPPPSRPVTPAAGGTNASGASCHQVGTEDICAWPSDTPGPN